MQSDLANASKKLNMYNTLYGSYPTTMVSNCPTAPNNDTNYCIKPSSSSTTFDYKVNTMVTPNTYSLVATNASLTYGISNNSSPVSMNTNITCPSGFARIPGSPTYDTNSFCVMKYEAKQVGTTTTPISTATGSPWVDINQTTAIANSPNVAGCKSCHLITEAEWLTIAQNVLSVASNWSSGVVGTGYIYSGHNDMSPANTLSASLDDEDVYNGTGNTVGSNQRRTLKLASGETIWDIAGNVYEWTSGQVSGG